MCVDYPQWFLQERKTLAGRKDQGRLVVHFLFVVVVAVYIHVSFANTDKNVLNAHYVQT